MKFWTDLDHELHQKITDIHKAMYLTEGESILRANEYISKHIMLADRLYEIHESYLRALNYLDIKGCTRNDEVFMICHPTLKTRDQVKLWMQFELVQKGLQEMLQWGGFHEPFKNQSEEKQLFIGMTAALSDTLFCRIKELPNG